jgi:two-component system OmpR family response regulator
MELKKRIWIVGRSGRLGAALENLLVHNRDRFEVLSTDVDDLNILDAQAVERYAERNRPDIIVNCAAYSNRGWCEEHVEETYDLIVLDINLPGMDGFTLLEKIRSQDQTVSIIMLTARDALGDRIRGLDTGANDYLRKPFDFPELQARIRSLLRRRTIQEDVILSAAGLQMDTRTRLVTANGKPLPLTKKEGQILEYLLLHKGRPVSQEEILAHAWDDTVNAFTNTVRVHLSALRKKIRAATGKNRITNCIGEGYRIDE